MGSVAFVPEQRVAPVSAGMASASLASVGTASARLASGGIGSLQPAGASAATNPRLVTAAHQFEAAMMQELLGPLTREMQGMGGLSGEAEDGVTDDGDGGPNQALTSFASEALGEALSERGGFGIASSVLKKLSHVAAKSAGPGRSPTASVQSSGALLPTQSGPQPGTQSGKIEKAGRRSGN